MANSSPMAHAARPPSSRGVLEIEGGGEFSAATKPLKAANFIVAKAKSDCGRSDRFHSFAAAQPNNSSPTSAARALQQEIPLIPDHQLRKAIAGLKSLERKCFASRSRFAFYDYLAAVFELYVRLRRRNQAKTAAQTRCKSVRPPQPQTHSPDQSNHRRDLDHRQQDQKPLDQGFAVRLA